jgi:hypothetical protein
MRLVLLHGVECDPDDQPVCGVDDDDHHRRELQLLLGRHPGRGGWRDRAVRDPGRPRQRNRRRGPRLRLLRNDYRSKVKAQPISGFGGQAYYDGYASPSVLKGDSYLRIAVSPGAAPPSLSDENSLPQPSCRSCNRKRLPRVRAELKLRRPQPSVPVALEHREHFLLGAEERGEGAQYIGSARRTVPSE